MSRTNYAKRSISLPEELDAELARQAASEGTTVSALLADAAEHALQIRRGLAAVDDWKREHRVEFTADEVAEMDELLDSLGIGVSGGSEPSVEARGAPGSAASK